VTLRRWRCTWGGRASACESMGRGRDTYTDTAGGWATRVASTEREASRHGTPGVVEHQHAREKGRGTYTDTAGCSMVEHELAGKVRNDGGIGAERTEVLQVQRKV